MTSKNASIARPLERHKIAAGPHGYSLLPGPMVMISYLLVVGCASAPPATVEVKVPVPVPCVTAVPARPEYEFGKLTLAASEGEKVLALARDWPRGRAYEGALEAVIAGCR